jgi:hypothetical protein
LRKHEKGIFAKMPVDKLFKLRMYAEIRYSYKDSIDHIGELKELTKDLFDFENITFDEFIIKPRDQLLGNWEIRIRPRRLTFAMDSCPTYDFFVAALEYNLDIISKVLTPQEVLSIGVQGYYLYSVNSLEDFSEVVTSWSQNYSVAEPDSIGISDLGVNVFFKEETLAINISCNFLTRDQAINLFGNDNQNLISDLNLFIDVNISTGDLMELKNALSKTLVFSIKTHINQATKKLEEKLESILKGSR